VFIYVFIYKNKLNIEKYLIIDSIIEIFYKIDFFLFLQLFVEFILIKNYEQNKIRKKRMRVFFVKLEIKILKLKGTVMFKTTLISFRILKIKSFRIIKDKV